MSGYNVNPLNQRRREPIAAQGEITGKAFLDTMELADRRENAADAFLLAQSYPGGENDHNVRKTCFCVELMILIAHAVFCHAWRNGLWPSQARIRFHVFWRAQ